MKNWELVEQLLRLNPNGVVVIVTENFKSCEVKDGMPIGSEILSVERTNPVGRRDAKSTIIIRRAL